MLQLKNHDYCNPYLFPHHFSLIGDFGFKTVFTASAVLNTILTYVNRMAKYTKLIHCRIGNGTPSAAYVFFLPCYSLVWHSTHHSLWQKEPLHSRILEAFVAIVLLMFISHHGLPPINGWYNQIPTPYNLIAAPCFVTQWGFITINIQILMYRNAFKFNCQSIYIVATIQTYVGKIW